MEYYPNYSLIKNASESAAWSSNLPQGLDLEVSRHPITMRHIIKLIIATERLKGGEGVTMGTEFKDKDLLNFFLESAVEEQIVLELESAPPASRRAAGFISTSQYEYSITDSENKSLVLMKESMELHAMMLQGGSSYHKVHFNMCMYVTPVPIETEARPVALGIKGSNLYLSCSKSGGRPTLHLEEVEDKEQLKSISNQSDMVRFLFYRRNTGVDITTLESAGFRNWFISTAMQQDNAKPVDMCKKEAPNRLTTFTIQRHN